METQTHATIQTSIESVVPRGTEQTGKNKDNVTVFGHLEWALSLRRGHCPRLREEATGAYCCVVTF